MTGSALIDFLIAIIGLLLVVGLIFVVFDRFSPDEGIKKIGRYAIGGATLIAFLLAIKGVLFGGAGAAFGVTPVVLIEFAIGLLVVLAVMFLIQLATARL